MQNEDAQPVTNNQSPITASAYRLTLDADGVYWGATEIHPEDVREGDIVLDHAPDNAPGKYRWDATGACLQALPKSQQKEAPGAPDLERAFDAMCHWLSDNGELRLPRAVEEWRAWYAKTIDQKKTSE